MSIRSAFDVLSGRAAPSDDLTPNGVTDKLWPEYTAAKQRFSASRSSWSEAWSENLIKVGLGLGRPKDWFGTIRKDGFVQFTHNQCGQGHLSSLQHVAHS